MQTRSRAQQAPSTPSKSTNAASTPSRVPAASHRTPAGVDKRPSQAMTQVSSEQKRNERISAATPSSPSPRSSVRNSQAQSSAEKPSLKVSVPAGSDIHQPRKPTTPPGSPRPAAHIHPRRTLSNPADQHNADSSPKKGVHYPSSDCSTHLGGDDVVKIQPDLAKEAGEGDEIVLYGQARTSWRSAAAVAHFVGDGCMALAQRGRLSALSAVGIYFVAVYLCVIATIHAALSTASVAGTAVMYVLGASVYVRLGALGAFAAVCMAAPSREGSQIHAVQETVRQGLLYTSLMALTAVQDGLASVDPKQRALAAAPAAEEGAGDSPGKLRGRHHHHHHHHRH